jgi:amino acid transporter
MQVLLTIAAIFGLTALFSYFNERFLKLQQTIGLMLLAVGLTLVLMLVNLLGLSNFSRRSRPSLRSSPSTRPF